MSDPLGQALTTVADYADENGAGLDVLLSVGQIGVVTLTTPEDRTPSMFKLDGRVGIWRSIAGRAPALDGQATFLIRDFERGPHHARYIAYHANELLERRIIAYSAGTSYTLKTGAGDDLIKAFIRENMGALISAANRDGSETGADISAYVGTQADLALGPSLSMAATRRNLARVIGELCDAATTAGTYLVCELVSPTPDTIEARVYSGQRGNDRRASTGAPIVLSETTGTLKNVLVRREHRNEITFVIAGGSGEGTARVIQTALDTARLTASPLNRRERFIEDTNVSDPAVLLDKAEAALRAGAPTVTMTADLVETPGCTRGLHFDVGDYVTAEAYGAQYDMRLNVARYTYSAGLYRSRVALRGVL